jgi:hypothetical protein
VSFITTGLRELALKVRRQKTRMALRHEKRLLQKSEINLGRQGCQEAANFPEVRNEIVALKNSSRSKRKSRCESRKSRKRSRKSKISARKMRKSRTRLWQS